MSETKTESIDHQLIKSCLLPKVQYTPLTSIHHLINGTKYLLIFDDSCEEISNSKQFVTIDTSGRHRGLNTIYIKANWEDM